MQFGYFDNENLEYVITRPDTPAMYSIVLTSRADIFICATTRMETTGQLPGSRSARIQSPIRACAVTGPVIRYLMQIIRGSTVRRSIMFRTV